MKKLILLAVVAMAFAAQASPTEKNKLSPEMKEKINKELKNERSEVLDKRIDMHKDMAARLEEVKKACQSDGESEKCKSARESAKEAREKHKKDIKESKKDLKEKRQKMIKENKQ